MRYEGIREVNTLPNTGNNYDIYLLKNSDGTATPYAYKDGEFVEVPLGGGGGGGGESSNFPIEVVTEYSDEEDRLVIIYHDDVTIADILAAINSGKNVFVNVYQVDEDGHKDDSYVETVRPIYINSGDDPLVSFANTILYCDEYGGYHLECTSVVTDGDVWTYEYDGVSIPDETSNE